jgi:hypothetical protein
LSGRQYCVPGKYGLQVYALQSATVPTCKTRTRVAIRCHSSNFYFRPAASKVHPKVSILGPLLEVAFRYNDGHACWPMRHVQALGGLTTEAAPVSCASNFVTRNTMGTMQNEHVLHVLSSAFHRGSVAEMFAESAEAMAEESGNTQNYCGSVYRIIGSL